MKLGFHDYLNAVTKRWRYWLPAVIVVPLLFGAYGYFAVPRQYQAKARILPLTGSQGSGMGALAMASALGFSAGSGGSDFSTNSAVYIQILGSRSLQTELIEKLELAQLWKTGNIDLTLMKLGEQREFHVDRLSQAVTVTGYSSGPPSGPLHIGLGNAREKDLAARQQAAQIAETYVDLLASFLRDNKVTVARNQIEFLEGRIETTGAELAELEDELLKFSALHGITDAAATGEMLEKRHAQIVTELEGATVKAQASASQAGMLRGRLANETQQRVASETFERNPHVTRLEEELMQIEQQLNQARTVDGKADTHPEVATLSQRKLDIEQALAHEAETAERFSSRQFAINPMFDSLRSNCTQAEMAQQAAQAQASILSTLEATYNDRLQQLPAIMLEYTALQQQIAIKREALAYFNREIEKARVEDASTTLDFIVLDHAVAPEIQMRSAVTIFGGVGFMLAIIASLLACFYLEGRTATAESEEGTQMQEAA